jgi:hypothetical protein
VKFLKPKWSVVVFSKRDRDKLPSKKKNEAKRWIDAAIKQAADELSSNAANLAAFLEILMAVRSKTSLLSPAPAHDG